MLVGLLIFFVQFAGADPPAPRIDVWARNPEAVRKIYPASQYRIMDRAEQETEWAEYGNLPPLRREALFHKLNLEDSLKGLDDVDKDILVMSARKEDPVKLRKYFPMLSEAQLKSLQAELKAKNK